MDACFLPRPFLFIIIIITFTATNWAFSFASAATSSSASTADGASLSELMVAWKANFSSWVGGDPCQGWAGVICNDNHRVISLNLSNKGLAGPIPQEISKLQYLTTLDLGNPRHAKPPLNQITGDLSALEGLTNLQLLNLSFNNIHLDTFPSVVFNLTNLIALLIDNNYLNGALPKELAQLTKLQYLYLGNNTLSGPIPSEFGNLVNLRELSLWNNDLNCKIPPELGNLINLTYLNLHSCNLYGGLPSELGNLTNIRNISLYENSLTGIAPDAWSKMKNLEVLLLYENYLTKYFPEWINELPNLLNVSLAYNLFYGAVPNFTGQGVQNVSLTCNFFSGTAPTAPETMTLNYSGNCFHDSDSNEKIKCGQTYFNCDAFLNSVQNGSCPRCPASQVLEDASTCVCTLDDGTGGGDGSKRWKLVGSILGVGGFLILLGFIWWMWSRSCKRSAQASARYHGRFYEIQGSVSGCWEGPEEVVRFNLQDLVNATENFHTRHEIGIGGFGKVFYAVLEGRKVAIKRAHLSSIQSSSGFRNEVLLLSRLHHKNLVHLLGFCEDEGIQILVYEFMPNGNLHTLLFRNGNTLDWLKRLDIAIGVAQGLEYLHSFADPPVIHRDVKPSNILLDENLVAKLSDFGISKVAPGFETHFATRPAGTVGYIDPQYILREQLTTASDVYSFGMVLLELISGQKSVDNTRLDEHNLVEWVKLKLNTEGLECIVDSRLGDRYPKQVYQDIVRLAIDCASFRSEDRPSMKAVVTILDACRWSVSPHLLEVPNDMQDLLQEHVSEEDISASQSSDRVLAKAMERSITEGSRNTFSVSLLLPR